MSNRNIILVNPKLKWISCYDAQWRNCLLQNTIFKYSQRDETPGDIFYQWSHAGSLHTARWLMGIAK